MDLHSIAITQHIFSFLSIFFVRCFYMLSTSTYHDEFSVLIYLAIRKACVCFYHHLLNINSYIQLQIDTKHKDLKKATKKCAQVVKIQ